MIADPANLDKMERVCLSTKKLIFAYNIQSSVFDYNCENNTQITLFTAFNQPHELSKTSPFREQRKTVDMAQAPLRVLIHIVR
jgi:hypothetical protein